MATVPNNLKRAIEASGRKRKWLAEQLGVSRVTLHRYEHGMQAVPEDRQAVLTELVRTDSYETRESIFPEEAVADAA